MRKPVLALTAVTALCLLCPPAQADVARDGLACAAGLSGCDGLAVTAEEALLVLGFDTQEDARFHYVALYGHGGQGRPDADLGGYHEVARFYDVIYNRSSCGGNSRAEPPGLEQVLSLGEGDVLTWAQRPLFHYSVTASETFLTFGHCGPLAQLDGRAAVDWAGPVTHIRSDEGPDAFGAHSGFLIVGQDRIVSFIAADHAAIPIEAGGREAWFVSFWQRIAAEDGSSVVPRPPVVNAGGTVTGTTGTTGATGSSGSEPPTLPPLPVPFAEIEAANRDPASVCTTLQQVIAALRSLGAVEMPAWAEAQLAAAPVGADRCADLLALLRSADATARDTAQPPTATRQGFVGFAPAPAPAPSPVPAPANP